MSAQNGHTTTQQTAKPRQEWIARRREEVARNGDENFSQMHYARKGLITEEMVYVAEQEKLSPRKCAMKWLPGG